MPPTRAPRSTLGTFLALVVALTTMLVGTGVIQPAAAVTKTAYSTQVKDATNDQRRGHDRAALDGNRCLKRFAQRHAEQMAQLRRIFHQDLGPVLRRCHLRLAGENVAAGFDSGRTVVDSGWMHSPGHRSNVLRKGFRDVAIGAKRSHGRWYVAQVFGRA